MLHLVTILFNSEDAISGFLVDLLAQGGVDWRLHVIDNASSDRAVDSVVRLKDRRIRITSNSKNLGFAKAANQGLRQALDEGAEFVVLMNNDVRFDADLLLRLNEARLELAADVISPRIMHMDAPGTPWYAGSHFNHDWIFLVHPDTWDPAAARSPRRVECATGCCLGLSRRVLQEVGLFDERFFVYWEDTDYCLRLHAAGRPVFYLPSVSLLHKGGSASGGEFTPGYTALYYRSYAKLIQKHFGYRESGRTFARLTSREIMRDTTTPLMVARIAASMLIGLGSTLLHSRRSENNTIQGRVEND